MEPEGSFITVFSKVCHRILLWVRWIKPKLSHSVSLRSILILFSHLRRLCLRSNKFPSVLSTFVCNSCRCYAHYMCWPFHMFASITLIIFYRCEYELWSSKLCIFYFSWYFRSNIHTNNFSQNPSIRILPLRWHSKFSSYKTFRKIINVIYFNIYVCIWDLISVLNISYLIKMCPSKARYFVILRCLKRNSSTF
jgi:hypothetical protein